MKKFKRAIAALLVMIMVLQPAAFAASVADFLDFPHDWSNEAMTAAVENGLYIGNDSKLIQPNKALTRAELAAFITRAFGATRTADISRLTDVSADDWFYLPVAKAYQMGALTGTSDTTFEPNAYITREQVFLVLARVLCISGTNEKAIEKFSDASQISSWAKNGVIGLAEKGYVNGYPNGTFRPQDNITRAELAQVFHNIFKMYIDAPGYYSQVPATGSVMIRVPGVHLENATVNGDVVIADGVANGDFDLASVNVSGRVLARGGEGKVTFKSVTVGEKVVVYDLNGTVNFNNYRTDAPFKNLDEITPATFLKKQEETGSVVAPGGGGSTGGGTKTEYFNVSFLDENGSILSPTQRIRSGSAATEPTAPTKDHYTFLYWSRNKNGKAYSFATAVTANLTLYAVFKKNPTVTFYVDNVADSSVEIPYDTSVAKPTDPTKEGHTFKYWATKNKDIFTEFDFTNKIQSDLRLYAVFEVNEYTVTFYKDEAGTETWITPFKKKYGETIDKPDTAPTSSNAAEKFAGWKLKGASDFLTFPYTVKGDTEIVPEFSLKTAYDVVFKVNKDDTTAFETQTVYEGGLAKEPTNIPTKTGHKFLHWSLTENGAAFDFATPITKATTLYAVFEKETYEVIFYSDEAGTVQFGETQNIKYNETVSEPTEKPTAPAGKDFSHWVLKGQTDRVSFPYTVTGKTEFVPVFVPKGTVAVTFMSDGVQYGEIQYVTVGTTATKPTDPVKTGYKFLYWSLTENGTEFDFATKLTESITLYAVFEQQYYTITFYTDDTLSTVFGTPVTDAKYGDRVIAPDTATLPVPSGKTFAYWLEVGTGIQLTDTYTVTGDAKFYAYYTDKDVFTVTFVANGATVDTVSVIDGEKIGTLPADPVLTGHSFEGWFAEENGEGTKVDANTVVTGNMTVYAYFKAELLTVAFYRITDYQDVTLQKAIQVPYGSSVNEVVAAKPTITIPENKATGFKRNASIASIYATLGIDDVHTVDRGWWFINGGKTWEQYDMDNAVTANVDLYDNSKEAQLSLSIPRLSSLPLTLSADYNEHTRAIDTVKDALFNSETIIKDAMKGEQGNKLLEQMVKRGVIDNTTDKNILNQHRYVRLVNVIGKNNIKKLIDSVIDSSINKEDAKQYIHDYITDYKNKSKDDQDKTVTALEKAFDTILNGANADKFKTALKPSVTKILVSDVETLKSLASAYVDSKVGTTAGKNQIISLLNKSLKQYKDTDKAALQTFIVNFVVSQVKAGNTEITKEIKDYIIDQIKAGSYKDRVDGYIKAYVDNDTVKSIVIAVADSDFAFISADISAEMTSDRDFAKTVFGQLYDTDANFRKTIKEELKAQGVPVDMMNDEQIKDAMLSYIGDETNDIAALVSEALAKLETNKSLRDSTIGSYLDGVLGGEGKDAFLTKLVDELYNNTKLLDNASVKPVIDKAAADMLADIDSYTDVVSDYVRSLVEKENFGILSENFVKLAKASRDTIISDLIDELKDQGLLESFISTFIDMQFDEGKIEETVVRKIVEYIADDKNSDTLDSITNAMFDSLTGEDLIDIAAALGQTEASAKVNAVNQLIDELCDEKGTDVTVTNDRLFMFEPILKMLKEHGWDFFEKKIPEKAKAVLPMDEFKVLFDRHYDAYVGSMEKAMADAAANPTETYYVGNGVQIDINPVSDILTPMLTYAKDMKAYAEGKASVSTREAFIKYYPYYEANPFHEAYEEFMVTDKWVTGTDNGYMAKLSGYKLYSLDTYYDIVKALSVVLDDTFGWYYNDDNVKPADREEVFTIAEDKVLAVANMINRFMVDYAVNGIPTNLKDLCLDIETDPTMIEIIKKFGLEKYLEKIEDNATAGKVYDTAYEKFDARFGARLEGILTRFVNSKLNRYYDDAEYQKAKEIIHGLFTPYADAYSVDTIFDEFLGGVDMKSEKYNGITLEILRHIFYTTDWVEE